MAADLGLMRLDAAPATIMPTSATPAASLPIRLILDIEASAGARLRQAELLNRHAPKRPLTRRIERTYWDTPGHDIGRAGLSVCVQRMGAKHLQIMDRIADRRTGGTLAAEDGVALAGERPDLIRLALTRGADPARLGTLDPASLIPLFAVDMKRTRWTLVWRGTTLTLDHDDGTIAAPTGHVPLHQMTLGVVDGPAAGLYDFAQTLWHDVPFRLADLDPAQAGYRLAVGEDWWPAETRPALAPAMATRDGILAIGRAALAGLRTDIALIAPTPTPERIHQARVAIRRLRSVLSVFGPVLPTEPRRRLARALGDLAHRLGKAREWDVFVGETLDPVIRALVEEPSLKTLRLTAQVLRDQAAGTLAQGLAAPDFMALSLDLGAWFDAGLWPAETETATAQKIYWLEQPLLTFARHVLRKRHRRVLDIGAALADPRPAELHRLRLEAKKLRYTAEFFAELFPDKPGRRYIAALREVQDVLGTLNDAATVPGLVQRLLADHERDSGYAAGVIAGWSAAEATAARNRFAKAWRRLNRVKPFWKGH